MWVNNDYHIVSLIGSALLCAYVYYYIVVVGRPVVRQRFPFYRVFKNKNIKNIINHCTIMQYILIVAFEFLLTFIGVTLLIRYYNHKA